MDAERIGQLGEALGLDPEFVSDVQQRGMAAVIDRAEVVDQTGAHGRLLGMVQMYGRQMEWGVQRVRPIPPGGQMEMAQKIAERLGVSPEEGIYLLGAVAEVYGAVARHLSRGKTGGANGPGHSTDAVREPA